MDKQLEEAMLKAEQDLAKVEQQTNPHKTIVVDSRNREQEFFVPHVTANELAQHSGILQDDRKRAKQPVEQEIHYSQRDIEKYGFCFNYQRKTTNY